MIAEHLIKFVTQIVISCSKETKRKYEAPIPTRVGKKKKLRGPEAANKLPLGNFSVVFIIHIYIHTYVHTYIHTYMYVPYMTDYTPGRLFLSSYF